MGIRVNSVLPTVVLTEMGRKSWSDPVVSAPMLDKIPLRKFAGDNDNNTSLLPTLSKGNIIEIDDVVSAALFLLSDAAAMITGVQLPVDGGATAI